MIRRAVLVTAIAGLLTLGAGIAERGVGAEERTPQNPAPQGTTPQPQPGMADMMKMHEQMMAEMKAGDAKLDALVKDMNTAAGDAKVKRPRPWSTNWSGNRRLCISAWARCISR